MLVVNLPYFPESDLFGFVGFSKPVISSLVRSIVRFPAIDSFPSSRSLTMMIEPLRAIVAMPIGGIISFAFDLPDNILKGLLRIEVVEQVPEQFFLGAFKIIKLF